MKCCRKLRANGADFEQWRIEKAALSCFDSYERIAPSLDGSVAWSWDRAHVHRTVKDFPARVQHPQSAPKVVLKTYMRETVYLIYTLTQLVFAKRTAMRAQFTFSTLEVCHA